MGDNGTISSGGLRNLKYFTVLSNLLAAAASVLNIIFTERAKKLNTGIPTWVSLLKYAGAVAVTLTLTVVVTFLGPVYKVEGLFRGANLVFHLIVPILAFVGFALEDGPEMSIKDSLIAVVPVVLYGIGYIGNILINGLGDSPYASEMYGFLYFGWGWGIVIFGILLIISWAAALVLRFIRKKRLNGAKNGR